MQYRRGFKREANELAREMRQELGLNPTDPLDPRILAHHLEVPLQPMSTLGTEAPFAVHYFSQVEQSTFSAMTVFAETERLIVYNDTHTPGRQASNLAHELSHALLGHPPTPALNQHGCREWDATIEAEATWLGGALLIPEEAALVIARERLPLAAAARRYGVSQTMVQFRLNVTGAVQRMAYLFAGRS